MYTSMLGSIIIQFAFCLDSQMPHNWIDYCWTRHLFDGALRAPLMMTAEQDSVATVIFFISTTSHQSLPSTNEGTYGV